ncbi:hypothetical protein [Prochlorococcus sp. MIT 1227]|uniref:hypothetical protein n=1 Tax=Prochlorococcus sp. MIT 1227 TaxID=3082536 RepID=UPI0039A69D9F
MNASITGPVHRLLFAAASLFSASSIFCGAVEADEKALFSCINKYKSLGISPDAALNECKEKSLANCIKSLMGKEKVESSAGKVREGYLIDLGDDNSVWMDGPEWRDRGCKPVTKGQSRTTRIGDPWNGFLKLEWFRQGTCSKSELKLGGTYSLGEAKNACELKAIEED